MGTTGKVTRGRKDPLQTIPGVGPSIAQDLRELGIHAVDELRGRSPESLYEEHCAQKGCRVDRCWLYVARCAVYFASHQRHDPEKLKWWNWKDDRTGAARPIRKNRRPKG